MTAWASVAIPLAVSVTVAVALMTLTARRHRSERDRAVVRAARPSWAWGPDPDRMDRPWLHVDDWMHGGEA